MKNINLLSTTIILLSIYYLTSCSNVDNLPLEAKLQIVLDDKIDEYNVRGVSAAIIFPNQEIWTGVSGYSYDTVLIKPGMLFAIGSITKNFVATLILKLSEKEILYLDDPLSKWLPEYPHVNSTVTIRQLLNHTSGIYMFWSNQKIWDDLKKDRYKVWTPNEILRYIKEPYFAPGEGWRYSNTNYLLLAMIIEKATGSKLSSEFDKYFWQPLDIDNAYLSMEDEIPDNLAHVFGDNYNNDGSVLDLTYLPRASHESITYGSSGLFMTAKELARWGNFLFKGEVLDQESMDEMLEFTNIGFGRQKRGYGLGVQLFTKRTAFGEKAIGHSGANIGTSAYMVYLPKHHITIVVMINDFNHDCSHAITKALTKVILKEYNILGIIPYFDFFPFGFLLIGVATALLILILIKTRKIIKPKTRIDINK